MGHNSGNLRAVASGVIDRIDGYLFDKPLLLIGEDGANLINRSTPIAFIARGRYWVNNHAHVLDAPTEDLLHWIELFINAADLTPYITGTAQPKMNHAKMNSIPVAIPPLTEQQRIVAKVDEHMAVCDELERSLAAVEMDRARALEAVLHEVLEEADAPLPVLLEVVERNLAWGTSGAHQRARCPEALSTTGISAAGQRRASGNLSQRNADGALVAAAVCAPDYDLMLTTARLRCLAAPGTARWPAVAFGWAMRGNAGSVVGGG
jgi:type I restriction enzyme S subunit